MYESSGKLKWIGETQTFPSGFTKREFVVTTAEKYPQDLKFEVVKDRCALVDPFEVGQDVTVNFDIRGNEYNGKYFVNLSAWKIQTGAGDSPPSGDAPPRRAPQSAPQGPPRAASPEPSIADLRNADDLEDGDDIPF